MGQYHWLYYDSTFRYKKSHEYTTHGLRSSNRAMVIRAIETPELWNMSRSAKGRQCHYSNHHLRGCISHITAYHSPMAIGLRLLVLSRLHMNASIFMQPYRWYGRDRNGGIAQRRMCGLEVEMQIAEDGNSEELLWLLGLRIMVIMRGIYA